MTSWNAEILSFRFFNIRVTSSCWASSSLFDSSELARLEESSSVDWKSELLHSSALELSSLGVAS